MLLLLITTVLKMVFVLTVLATYSPVLVWAERRQSAMLQDRIGPVRGGFPLPEWLANLIRGPVALGAWGVVALGILVAALAAGMLLLHSMSPHLPLILLAGRSIMLGLGILAFIAMCLVWAHAFNDSILQGV